jgi:hypothetical protein
MSEPAGIVAPEPVPEGMKRCSACHAVKDLEDGFPVNRRSKDGRGSACSACNAERCSDYQSKIITEALTAYGGGRCSCCGTDRAVVLMLVSEGQAAKAGSWSGGGFPKAFRLRQQGWPEGWRVVCANCRLAENRAGRCDCSDDGSAEAA